MGQTPLCGVCARDSIPCSLGDENDVVVRQPTKMKDAPAIANNGGVSTPRGPGAGFGPRRAVSLDDGDYLGEWQNNRRHGFGAMDFHVDNGIERYEGQWSDDAFDGYGTCNFLSTQTTPARIYAGQWKSGKMHGSGTMAWEDGCVYEGAFASDRKDGYGVFRWPYGRSWAGQWKDGRQHGYGTMCDALTGAQGSGRWESGVRMNWETEPGRLVEVESESAVHETVWKAAVDLDTVTTRPQGSQEVLEVASRD